jgi:hypothetical protein
VTDGLSPIPDDGRVFSKLESADPAGWPRRPGGGPLGDAGPGPRAGGRVHVTGTGALSGLRLRVPVAASLQWAVFATRGSSRACGLSGGFKLGTVTSPPRHSLRPGRGRRAVAGQWAAAPPAA